MHRYREFLTSLGWTVLILAVFVTGQTIPLPNLDVSTAQDAISHVTFLRLFANVTGSDFSNQTLFSVGMGPFMSAMIIWQAVQAVGDEAISHLSPHQVSLGKYGITLVLAIAQSFQVVYLVRGSLDTFYFPGTQINIVFISTIIILVAGAMFVAWLANLNAAIGIGSSVALIIPGIVRGIPGNLINGFGDTEDVPLKITATTLTAAIIIGAIFLVLSVITNAAELRLPIERPMLDQEHSDSYLPIKVLTSAGMPFMFSSSLFMLPRYFVNQTVGPTTPLQHAIVTWFSYRTPQGILVYALVLILLNYAFGYINLQPSRQAKTLRESDDYLIGVPAGDATEAVIMHHFNLLTFISNFLILLVGVGPLIVGLWYPAAVNYSLYLGSVLILAGMVGGVADQIKGLINKNRYQIFD
ncbi:preprotein translocase subunit SecY [Levilactobacillus suantsaii]|uniref:Preprotein translocase subunit SecY n=1 Tax=Levilactobacillus suantsaii TaxID=2292255 RepID=A0A4Q0VIA7_9LACO|nr:preprotein translocase subunit SecY [Levilactobacillus suantsaii]QMU08520.1 preprotein translocase subunit SecY [Levilactobacillus suantsaii]RXI78485.1 preprotein translocase subunit SecY [Levilactobacillus suantsaii]